MLGCIKDWVGYHKICMKSLLFLPSSSCQWCELGKVSVSLEIFKKEGDRGLGWDRERKREKKK